jgi:predicted metal-binding protein
LKTLEIIETKNVLKDSENDLDLSQEKELIICKNCGKSEQNLKNGKNEKCFYHSGKVVFVFINYYYY